MMPNNQTEALGLSDLAATGTIAALAAERDAGVGLNVATVEYLSDCKSEPAWLRAQRLEALRAFFGRETRRRFIFASRIIWW